MPEVELRLFHTRGSTEYDAVPVRSRIALEVWTKGTYPRKQGNVIIEEADIRCPQRLARVRPAPHLEPMFALVEDMTSPEEEGTGNRHYRIKSRGIAGLWPTGTDHFTVGDSHYQRAEVFVFAN